MLFFKIKNTSCVLIEYFFKKIRNNRGFTLVEFLVGLVIIGTMVSIIVPAVGNFRMKTRDARRINDLSQVRDALYLYYSQTKNWVETGSGCGWSGNGNGFFSYPKEGTAGDGYYVHPISQCLQNAGLLANEIVDPSGGRASWDKYKYMKYTVTASDGRRVTCLYAALEATTTTDTSVDGSICNGSPGVGHDLDTEYGMNYYLDIK